MIFSWLSHFAIVASSDLREFEMFNVRVKVNGNEVRNEVISTMPELKSFLHGIQETTGNIVGYAFDNRSNAMIVQEAGNPIRNSFTSSEKSVEFLKKFKKSAYA